MNDARVTRSGGSSQRIRRSLSSSDLPIPLPFACHRRPSESFFFSPVSSSNASGAITRSRSLMRPSTSPTFMGGLHESSPSTTHRVSFNIETNGRAAAGNNSQAEHKTNVINLPWADVRGSEAKYTGEVNLLMQPHGFGFLVYKDGSIFSSIWCNGMPSPKPSAHDQVTTTLEEPSRRRVFDLEDVACPKDMQHPSPECAFEEHCFPIHSFAFILRSSGHWTYAIIANRPVLSGPEASIRFVVDKRGSTKIIKRRQWGKYIRFIRKEGDMSAVDDEQDGRLYQGRVMNQACLDQLSAYSGLGKGVTTCMSIKTNER